MSALKCLLAVTILSCAAVAQAQVVGIGTNPQGSMFYSVGTAVAKVMQEKGGLTARVQPTSGSSAYAPLINRGELEFGLINVMEVVDAYTGVQFFKDRKNPNLRLVGAMFSLPIGIAVPNDAPVKSIKDLKGLRMPSNFTAQNTIVFVQDAVLATGGLSTADMKAFPVANYVKGMEALRDGKVDAALYCFACAAGQEANVALASRGGLRFVSLADTPEALAAMRRLFPNAYTVVFKPEPAYAGIVGPTRLMVFSAFLFTSTHVPDDVVYRTTKAIHENKDALVAASTTLKSFAPAMMAEENPVPYHSGAERFYREVNQWPPRKR